MTDVDITTGFNEGIEVPHADIIDALRNIVEKTKTRAETYEKNSKIDGMFAFSDDIITHTIIKAFLLSSQKKEDLTELIDALSHHIACCDYEDDDEMELDLSSKITLPTEDIWRI